MFGYHLIIYFLMQLINPSIADPVITNDTTYIKPPITSDYFRSPVSFTFKLAGTFGELRPNHFHTGIDIKSSAGVAGDDILAAADGWISRIGVSPQGYGNALYIDHPNGYTTVYGHLKNYNTEISKYVLEEQLKQKRFDVQLYLEKEKIVVKKGQIIGNMGNSGSSKGAHLHFEIRETLSETPVNPFLFKSISMFDQVSPRINYIRVYELDNSFNENGARNELVSVKNGIITPRQGDTILLQSDLVGVGINTRDAHNSNYNLNGVYQIRLLVDELPYYEIRMDSVTFFKTRMINAHLDYPEQLYKRNYVHKCFTLPGNDLGIILKEVNKGLIDLSDGKIKKIEFQSSDYYGNTTKFIAFLKRKPGEKKDPVKVYNYELPFDEASEIHQGAAKIKFSSRTFFKNHKLNIITQKDKSSNVFSENINIGKEDIPVFTYYHLTLDGSLVPPNLKNRAFIASCDKNNRIHNWGGIWEGNDLSAELKSLGGFFITADTLKPSIVPIIFGSDMRKANRMVFKIDDNVIPAGKTPLLQYNAWIDDNWIVMIYDLKNKSLQYNFPVEFKKGTHKFKLEVTDAVGNVAVYEKNFTK